MKPHCATGAARRPVALRAPAAKHRRRRRFAAFVVAIASLPAAARAEGLALWEVGLGVAGLYLPDYRGADRARGYALPFPVVVYR
ncbi:MAG: hypothetical protein ACK4V1_14985, partial [Burkholderiaceae bacterium]